VVAMSGGAVNTFVNLMSLDPEFRSFVAAQYGTGKMLSLEEQRALVHAYLASAFVSSIHKRQALSPA
jgi:hypothetical protein